MSNQSIYLHFTMPNILSTINKTVVFLVHLNVLHAMPMLF